MVQERGNNSQFRNDKNRSNKWQDTETELSILNWSIIDP